MLQGRGLERKFVWDGDNAVHDIADDVAAALRKGPARRSKTNL